MFKKPITVNHNVGIDLPDLEAATTPVLDRVSEMLKTTFITLAIAIPVVIVFGVTANVVGDVVTDKLTNNE